MPKPLCNTCKELDGTEVEATGIIDGEPYCQRHLTNLNGITSHYGMDITPIDTEISETSPVKRLPLALPSAPNDVETIVDMLGHVMRGVLDGSYSPRQANAVCMLSQTAMKAVELDWKMKLSKDISYVVKQLERP